MTAPIAVDTPDYTRGVVSAQKLLAAATGGGSPITVGIPPNTETLIVIITALGGRPTVKVSGVSTGHTYPGVPFPSQFGQSQDYCWMFDVSSAVDTQVSITGVGAPLVPYAVYADSGVHIMADMSKLSSSNGMQYVIPTVPNTAAGDHPPNELSVAHVELAAAGNILGAPGAGIRYRIFSVQMSTLSALSAIVWTGGGAPVVAVCAGPGNSITSIPAQGVPWSVNTAVVYGPVSGAGTMLITVLYTTETV